MKIDLNSMKTQLDRLKCSEHGNYATISVVNSNINFKCCCDAFKKQLESKTTELIQIESKKMIENEMKKIFKK